MKPRVIRRARAKLEDLTPKDIRLLTIAYGLPEESFLCFGQSYYKLQELGLISDENQITLVGRQLIWSLSQESKAKKVEQ